MADSIREQIVTAIESKLADIGTDKAYLTNIGDSVYRVMKKVDPDNCPACNVFPLPEDCESEYGETKHMFPIKIESHSIFDPSIDNASAISEKMLADLIDCMVGHQYEVDFTSGGVYEVQVGDTIEGATSGATATVEAVSLGSGTWAGGDAAGSFTLRHKKGIFGNSENINVGVNNNVATLSSSTTNTPPETSTCNDLADDIQYVRGGTDDYPNPGEKVVGSSAEFLITYYTLVGDPYNQD